MRTMFVLTLFAAWAGAALAAQSPYGGGMGGQGGTGDTPRVTPTVNPLPTPEDLAGPALPDFVVDRFELDTTEAQAYRAAYDSFMTATRPLRDSALASRRRIDAQWQNGDRGGARLQLSELRRLGDALEKEDRQFDDRVVKRVMSKAHYRDYSDWRKDQRKEAEAYRNERMKQMTGAANRDQ